MDTEAELMARLWDRLGAIDGFMEGASIFSDDDRDRAYFVNGTQVANLDGAHIGLRLTRKVVSANRAQLKSKPRVDLRRSGSDWIVLTIEGEDDIDLAVELARLAAEAHLPQDGRALRAPPEGAELERRRRFH